jgi:hypothetical protein
MDGAPQRAPRISHIAAIRPRDPNRQKEPGSGPGSIASGIAVQLIGFLRSAGRLARLLTAAG